MRITLISPCIDAEKRTNKGLMMPQLSLHILAGLTPKEHQLTLIEEEIQDVNLDADCDLVGLSCMTANAPRAYELAAEFKKRGKTVVMGGVHPTILPDEALKHADCVVVGEAEGVWPKLLEDFAAGRLQRKYEEGAPDMDQYVCKDFSKIIGKRLFQLVPIMTTRGCPYRCDFCCVSDLYGTKIRHTSIDNVLRDIHDSKAKNFMFLDDNIIGHAKYAKELFKAIKPMKINWVGQASVSLLVRDDELMQLAAESGCRGLFFGLESVSESQLGAMKKAIKDIENLENALLKIRKSKILIHASMVFGFDSDTPKVFDETVDFLIRNNVSTASFNILTPYPGTKTYKDLNEAGRLITTDWRYYDHNTVVYQPTNMSPYELQMGKINARRRFYSASSIAKRLPANLFGGAIYLATNLAHRRQVKVEAARIERLKGRLFGANV